MSMVYVALRRTLPDGTVVTVTLEQERPDRVYGVLQVERRRDPTRLEGHPPPVVAEAHGPTQADVLAQLRRIAESDAEVAEHLDEWQAARRIEPPPPA
jgi:hypothetical protein